MAALAYDIGTTRELHERHAQKLQAIARLSQAVACEVNGPLQQAESNLRFLEQALSGMGPEVAQALSQTLQGLSRVAAGVHALQRFARPEGEGRRAADVNAALRLCFTLASAELRLGAGLQAELAELPPVACDPVDLHEVFLCLLLNAARASSTGGRRGLVEVTSRADGSWAVVTIKDAGDGIPEALQAKLFDPKSTTEARRQLGEGLPLAHALVAHKHGGSLRFETMQGEGTTFTVRLPLASGGR